MTSVLSKRTLARSAGKCALLVATMLFGIHSAWSQIEAAKAGWLYVLDTQNQDGNTHVLLVDPSNGRVVRKIPIGAEADAALAPDGRYLYVASKYANREQHSVESRLEIYDSTGSLIAKVANPDQVGATVPWYPTRMAMSPSGNWLYMVKMHFAGFNDQYLTAFDTRTRQFSSGRVSLIGCKSAVLLPAPEDRKLEVVCNGSAIIRVVTLGDSEASSKADAISVEPTQPGRSMNWHLAYLHPFTEQVGVITANGASYLVNKHLGKAEALSPAQVRPAGSPVRTLGTQRGLLSGDGSTVYFGDQTTALPYSAACDQIVSAESATLTRRQTVKTPLPFFSFALSSDGKTAYAVSPEKSTMTVMDLESGKPLRQFQVGQTPTMVFPIP
jgi:hypothetical protein